MKYLHHYLTLIAAVALTACSSMEVDEDEVFAENFPKDFVDSVYMQVHPELRSLQIKDYVKSYNDSLSTSSGSDFDEKKQKDIDAFNANVEQLHEIFVNPYYMGYSEKVWEDNMSEKHEDSLACQTTVDYKSVLVVSGSDTARIVIDSIKFDAGNFKTVYGYDSADAEKVSKIFDIGETIKVASIGQVYDTLKVCDTIDVIVPGELNAIQKSLIASFNFYDQEDDLAMLEKVPLDITSIVYQYTVYGRDHGWAYRFCTEEEAGNPVQTEEYPNVTMLYCVDENGVVREIK